jgi:hypothetical protein
MKERQISPSGGYDCNDYNDETLFSQARFRKIFDRTDENELGKPTGGK